MKIIVIGAGAWGSAVAISAAAHPQGHEVTLWSRSADQHATMQAARVNQRYLPDAIFPATLALANAADMPLSSVANRADLVVLASPMAGLRMLLTELQASKAPVAWLCKGFEAGLSGASARPEGALANSLVEGLLGHEILAQVAPQLHAGVLSGPSFAQEVAAGRPTALVAASEHASVRDALVEAFHSPSVRVYANEDIVGVEVGGAVKNVLAIATGLCDGLALGLNARAALITRGLAEMTRLGLALGARAETFMGLSGLGDLVLTATGDLSRNRRVGLLLAQGHTLAQAVQSLNHVAEGVYCARTVVQRARDLGVEMPISEGVVALLDGTRTPEDVVAGLMERDPAPEAI